MRSLFQYDKQRCGTECAISFLGVTVRSHFDPVFTASADGFIISQQNPNLLGPSEPFGAAEHKQEGLASFPPSRANSAMCHS